jgi:CheY-like chemotaxis protein
MVQGGVRKRIVAVDDDEDYIYIIKTVLEREGYEVEGLTCGRECLRRVRELKPDLLILDVIMPDMDGWEVCRKIKESPSTSSIPVLILSIRSDGRDVERSLKYARADSHLAKPIEFKELTRTVKELLT